MVSLLLPLVAAPPLKGLHSCLWLSCDGLRHTHYNKLWRLTYKLNTVPIVSYKPITYKLNTVPIVNNIVAIFNAPLLYSISILFSFSPITLEGRWGTTDGFAITPFHPVPFSAALAELAKSIPIHSWYCFPISSSVFLSLCPVGLSLTLEHGHTIIVSVSWPGYWGYYTRLDLFANLLIDNMVLVRNVQ